MCITIVSDVNCSHVSIEVQCIHLTDSKMHIWYVCIGIETQMSIKFREKKKENKKMGIDVEHNTKHSYEYGVKCVRI